MLVTSVSTPLATLYSYQLYIEHIYVPLNWVGQMDQHNLHGTLQMEEMA